MARPVVWLLVATSLVLAACSRGEDPADTGPAPAQRVPAPVAEGLEIGQTARGVLASVTVRNPGAPLIGASLDRAGIEGSVLILTPTMLQADVAGGTRTTQVARNIRFAELDGITSIEVRTPSGTLSAPLPDYTAAR